MSKKKKEKIAKRTIAAISWLFRILLAVLFWFGTFKADDYPLATLFLIAHSIFLAFWFGKIRDELLFG